MPCHQLALGTHSTLSSDTQVGLTPINLVISGKAGSSTDEMMRELSR
jgi:hypothetical protein